MTLPRVVETVLHPLLPLDSELRVEFANLAFYQTFNTNSFETLGRMLFELDASQWNVPAQRSLVQQVVLGVSFEGFEFKHEFPRLGRRVMVQNARRVQRNDGTPPGAVLTT